MRAALVDTSRYQGMIDAAKIKATIRELYAGGGYSQSQLASQFGVRQTMISKIVTRQSWKHI